MWNPFKRNKNNSTVEVAAPVVTPTPAMAYTLPPAAPAPFDLGGYAVGRYRELRNSGVIPWVSSREEEQILGFIREIFQAGQLKATNATYPSSYVNRTVDAQHYAAGVYDRLDSALAIPSYLREGVVKEIQNVYLEGVAQGASAYRPTH